MFHNLNLCDKEKAIASKIGANTNGGYVLIQLN